MIKFFRKIRQKMLTENKFSKYLLYACGEILLVVIGILIALSINNWNENQIEIKTINSYLKKIESNVQQDLKMAQSLLEFRINNSAQCVKASEMLINRDFSDQATIQNAISGLLIEISLNFNRSAFESL
jgi:sensor domain CHASE-containing protein